MKHILDKIETMHYANKYNAINIPYSFWEASRVVLFQHHVYNLEHKLNIIDFASSKKNK